MEKKYLVELNASLYLHWRGGSLFGRGASLICKLGVCFVPRYDGWGIAGGVLPGLMATCKTAWRFVKARCSVDLRVGSLLRSSQRRVVN